MYECIDVFYRTTSIIVVLMNSLHCMYLLIHCKPYRTKFYFGLYCINKYIIIIINSVQCWTDRNLYYKRGVCYLCSAKAPVLDGYGRRRLYALKGTKVGRVYVVFGARVDPGCFTIRQKRIRGGGAFAEGNIATPAAAMNVLLSQYHASLCARQ